MKILILDISTSHGNTCKNFAQNQCPTAEVEMMLGDLSEGIQYAIDNGFSIISRSTTGLCDYVDEIYGGLAYANGIGICMAHSDNVHSRYTEPSKLGYICAVGAGTPEGTFRSYGPGMEFYSSISNYESYATPSVAGLIGQLMINNPTWTFQDARQAIRQTASLFGTGWIEHEGFGDVDYTAAKAVTTPLPSQPINKEFVFKKRSVVGESIVLAQNGNPELVVSKTTTRPARYFTPSSAEILGGNELKRIARFTGVGEFLVFQTKIGSVYSVVENNVEADFYMDSVEIVSGYLPSISTPSFLTSGALTRVRV